MDATFFSLVGLILFLGLLIWKKVPGMITKGLDSRADKIKDELDQARQMREEAQALLAEYQRKRREAESEAEEIVEAAKKDAKSLAADAKRKLDEYVERRTQAAEVKIKQAEIEAVNDVKAASIDKAVAAAQVVLQKRLAEDSESVLKKSIDDVAARLN